MGCPSVFTWQLSAQWAGNSRAAAEGRDPARPRGQGGAGAGAKTRGMHCHIMSYNWTPVLRALKSLPSLNEPFVKHPHAELQMGSGDSVQIRF